MTTSFCEQLDAFGPGDEEELLPLIQWSHEEGAFELPVKHLPPSLELPAPFRRAAVVHSGGTEAVWLAPELDLAIVGLRKRLEQRNNGTTVVVPAGQGKVGENKVYSRKQVLAVCRQLWAAGYPDLVLLTVKSTTSADLGTALRAAQQFRQAAGWAASEKTGRRTALPRWAFYLPLLAGSGTGLDVEEFRDLGPATEVPYPEILPDQPALLAVVVLVERRLPVTVAPAKRRLAKSGRYHLADPYFRFYFRFIHQYRDELAQRREQLLPAIQDKLRAFVGATAFEELGKQWLVGQARAGRLPLTIQEVGAHWSAGVQVNVVAVNWPQREILLGECKWGEEEVDRGVLRELLEVKTPRVLKLLPGGAAWHVHHAFFARRGFTAAAWTLARSTGALLVDLATLDADLYQHSLAD